MKIVSLLFAILSCFAVYGQIREPQAPQFPNSQQPSPNPYGAALQPGGGMSSDARRRDEQMIRDEMAGVDEDTRKWQAERAKEAKAKALQQKRDVFVQAFTKLKQMQDGIIPYSLKQASFICENAYHDNTLKWENFCKPINEAVNDCRLIMLKYHLDPNNKLACNLAIQMYMNDTIFIRQGKVLRGYTYDHDNFDPEKSWENMSISKILKTRKGQCHSMPSLYKILSEELHTEAFLSDITIHGYIQFRDLKGRFYNYEATNGTMPSDVEMQNYFYVKTAALQNKIYMQPLTNRQVISGSIIDLARAYQWRFGERDTQFVVNCMKQAAKYYSNYWRIFAIRNNILYDEAGRAFVAAGSPSKEDTKAHPERYRDFLTKYDRLLAYDDKIKTMGYEHLPTDIYEQMLAVCAKKSPGKSARAKMVSQVSNSRIAQK
jgi:hypothetical protein